MAIPVERLHYSFLQRANHSDSEYLRQLTVAQRDGYLNRSKNWFIPTLSRYYNQNAFIDDQLRPLLHIDDVLDVVEDGDAYVEVAVPGNMLRMLRRTVYIKHADCTEERARRVWFRNSEKIDSLLSSAYRSPSWKYRETVSMRTGKGLAVYHGDDFKVTKVLMDWMHDVPDVAGPEFEGGGGYIDAQGRAVSQNRDLEVESEWIAERIVKGAAIMALDDAGYLNNAQAQLQELVTLPSVVPR